MTWVYDRASSLKSDGHRNFVYPADVAGRFHNIRRVAFAVLMGLLAALPWITIKGHPAVFLDVQHRRFYLFGNSFNAQDFWLVFFLLSGVGFSLFVVTALWGRIFCGYVCPQTVFLEGLFRPVERLIEGPRQVRMRRNAGPITWEKLWRKALKHGIYVVFSFLIAHIILSYFVSLPGVYQMVLHRPAEHPEAFAWAGSLTVTLYLIYSWFREQLCLIVCPYGRLQSAMTDRDTIVIGYDEKRGEPRGKASNPQAGDCVDCRRCVVVCPTGIDIRNGLQIDCVGCARCIDACDEVMLKLRRPQGLVRYDSSRGFAGERRQLWRPRLMLYTVLGAIGLFVMSFAISSKADFEANVLRLPGAPYVVQDGTVRNGFQIHLVNKDSESRRFHISGMAVADEQFIVSMPTVELPSLGSQHVPVFVSFRKGTVTDGTKTTIVVDAGKGDIRRLFAPLTAPR